MTILVAGGAGFIGSHLCDRLIRDGHHVLCMDNLITGRLTNIHALIDNPRFSYVHHDAIEELPALPTVDGIYHLASPASPAAFQRHAIATMRVNGEGTRRLLDLAVSEGARFLFASTSEVYGDPLEHPQREDYRGNVSTTGPRSMYDESKRYGEALTQAYAEELGVETRIVRIFNTYGPRLGPLDGRVVSNFIVQALANKPLTIYGDGTQSRSYQYIDDLVEGLVRAMDSPFRGPVNLGNPEEYTVLELAQLVQSILESDAGIEFRDLPVHDPRLRKPDIELARVELGWQPRISLPEGLRKTIEHLRFELAEQDRVLTGAQVRD